ncbi:MAG TPA: acetyl-CoA carboxylase biotin carboxyl carrier protein [Candidatus Krumholzibacteria bacterium]|nr:acetyl-CoA carboxylase biotin carboxyl carrier protein [Candidatus Krumholzibacteria bacterium]
MRKNEIEELIRLVEDSNINELEVSHGRSKIRISKGGGTLAPMAAAAPVPAPVAVPRMVESDGVDGDGAGEEKLASNLKQIKSPMVGTFYRSPAPGSEPFIDIGQNVVAGQTVCIVEAMKLMNEIGSDFNGVIRRVLTENGQPVEYGQPLFLIETK